MKQKPNGEGSLLRRPGSPYWYGSYYVNGVEQRQSTKETDREKAAKKLRKWMVKADHGLKPEAELRSIRYGDLRKMLIDSYRDQGNKSLELRSNGSETINGLNQLDSFFGYNPPDNMGWRFPKLTTQASDNFKKKRQAEGAGNAMVNRSLACLRRMFALAYKNRIITRDSIPPINFLKEPPARAGFVAEEKFRELLKLLPAHLRPLVLFLYYTGVRKNEALSIGWDQVDLDASVVRLAATQTKNGSARTIPLTRELVSVLQEIEPKEGKIFDGTNLRVEWERACSLCGLGQRTKMPPKEEDGFEWWKYRGLLLHDLRRSAVRNLRLAGNTEDEVMAISGHQTAEVFRRYDIVDEGDRVMAMRRLEAFNLQKSYAPTVAANSTANRRKPKMLKSAKSTK